MAFHRNIALLFTRLLLGLSLSLPTLAGGNPAAPGKAIEPLLKTGGANAFLPVDQAFVLESEVGAENIELIWTVAPGYYLYRHKFSVQLVSEGVALGEPLPLRLEPGIRSHDDYYGAVEIYYHQALASLSLDTLPGTDVDIAVSYQGCAEAGLCYPTQTQQLKISTTTTPAGDSTQAQSSRSLF